MIICKIGVKCTYFLIIILEDYHDCQSPINIITKNIKKRKLPPLRTRGYSKFEDADVEIINTGLTG